MNYSQNNRTLKYVANCSMLRLLELPSSLFTI